jgi:tRNA(His) guanylyltransferase
MEKSSLGDRMKGYEKVPSTQLMLRTPVIMRLDGKAFHSFTRGMDRPFDENLIQAMQETTRELVWSIEGCTLGYTQSDEITLLITDYKKLTTQAWFGYRVQKMVSVASSMCTAYFNRILFDKYAISKGELFNKGPAFFDARVFNIPKEEVVNCFLWRQNDCTRNSIQMVGQANFSHKQLHKKSCEDIQEMLFQEKGINWNDFPTHQKRGTAVYKDDNLEVIIDKEIPIFSKDREFIQKWVDVEETD